MADTSKMRLHWSPRSPFVRKVMIAAHELGLADRLETIRTRVATNQVHKGLLTDNPIGKIPTLLLADGTILYDSVVICEYLDSIAPQPKLFPAAGAARFQALRRHALGCPQETRGQVLNFGSTAAREHGNHSSVQSQT